MPNNIWSAQDNEDTLTLLLRKDRMTKKPIRWNIPLTSLFSQWSMNLLVRCPQHRWNRFLKMKLW